jgi:hypothetical protein
MSGSWHVEIELSKSHCFTSSKVNKFLAAVTFSRFGRFNWDEHYGALSSVSLHHSLRLQAMEAVAFRNSQK